MRSKKERTVRRTVDQNRLMWGLLTDWAEQDERYTFSGERLDAHDFKELTMAAFKKEVRLTPNLENTGVVYLSRSTSRLSKDQMTEYIEFLKAEGAMRGIVFRHIPPEPLGSPPVDFGPGLVGDTAPPPKTHQQPRQADLAIVPRNQDELRMALQASVYALKEKDT